MNRRWLLLFLLLSPAALLARADEDEVEEEAVVDDEVRTSVSSKFRSCVCKEYIHRKCVNVLLVKGSQIMFCAVPI